MFITVLFTHLTNFWLILLCAQQSVKHCAIKAVPQALRMLTIMGRFNFSKAYWLNKLRFTYFHKHIMGFWNQVLYRVLFFETGLALIQYSPALVSPVQGAQVRTIAQVLIRLSLGAMHRWVKPWIKSRLCQGAEVCPWALFPSSYIKSNNKYCKWLWG